MVKKYNERISNLKERVCLLAYGDKQYGTELAQTIYGSRHSGTQLYGRVLPELVEKGYVKDLGKGEGFLTTPAVFIEEIKKYIDITESQEETIKKLLDSPLFRECLGKEEFYDWVDRYRMHPLSVFFNLLGIYSFAGIKIKPVLTSNIKHRALKQLKKQYEDVAYISPEKIIDFSDIPPDILKVFIQMIDPFTRDIITGSVEGALAALKSNGFRKH